MWPEHSGCEEFDGEGSRNIARGKCWELPQASKPKTLWCAEVLAGGLFDYQTQDAIDIS